MAQKRKADQDDESDAASDNEIDITSVVAGKRTRNAPDSDESDEELSQFIHESIAKRNVKGGTEVLKKVKGRNKLVKGEVGGGSFQSMGVCIPSFCGSHR